MTTDHERDPLYVDSKMGDLGNEIIEIGIERRRAAREKSPYLDADFSTTLEFKDEEKVSATEYAMRQDEHRRLLAWAMGPDVRGASLEQLRSMKMAFDDTKSGAVRLVLRQMRRIEALEKVLIAISRCEDRGRIYLLVSEALKKGTT